MKTIEEYVGEGVDCFIVTSSRFFQEMKELLMKKGIEESQILLIDNLFYNMENYSKKVGLEVGGPSSMFQGIYKVCSRCDGVNFSEKTMWWKGKNNDKYIYEDQVLGKILIEDATDLRNIENDSYDFVLSSNNLEHIANPLKALQEFCRIVKVGGVVLIAVPIKEK